MSIHDEDELYLYLPEPGRRIECSPLRLATIVDHWRSGCTRFGVKIGPRTRVRRMRRLNGLAGQGAGCEFFGLFEAEDRDERGPYRFLSWGEGFTLETALEAERTFAAKRWYSVEQAQPLAHAIREDLPPATPSDLPRSLACEHPETWMWIEQADPEAREIAPGLDHPQVRQAAALADEWRSGTIDGATRVSVLRQHDDKLSVQDCLDGDFLYFIPKFSEVPGPVDPFELRDPLRIRTTVFRAALPRPLHE